MLRYPRRKPQWFSLGLTCVFLALAAACGSAATPTPAPTATRPPQPSPTSVPTPTPVGVATQPPSGDQMGSPEVAPAFADYWKPPTDYYGQPVYGGTLRINYEDPLEHGNVWGAYTGAASRLRNATMNKIIDVNPYNEAELIPDLARGWTLHDGGTGVTFYFNEGVTWHNGEPFVCEDARFWLHTVITGEGLTISDLKGKLNYIDLEKSKCLDDHTLELIFNRPNGGALSSFTDRAATVFNKKWFTEKGEDALTTDLSVGTGAFVWAAGQEVGVDEQHFEKNPNYFKKGLPYVDEVVIFGIVEESRQQASMLAHQTDWHWVRNWGQYDAYVDHDQILTVIRATAGHHTVWLNPRKAPLDNVKVRQALFMAMDREAGIKVLQDGHGALGFMMPAGGPWDLDKERGCAVPAWCPPADGDMARQRAEARAILKAEGFDFNKTLVMTVESDAQVQQRATFVQEQLRLIDVKVDFDLVETVAWRKQAADGSWGDILPRNDTMPAANDPGTGMGFYFRCASANNHWTPGTPCDPKAESLLDQLSLPQDLAKQKALSDELQLYTMQQYWRFPLYWEQEAVAFWPEVRGYFHLPAPNLSQIKWEHMWMDPAHRNDKGFKGQTSGVPGGV